MTALGGSETDLETLLIRSIHFGQQTLADVTRRALLRLLHFPHHVLFTGNFFALHEQLELMEALATVRSAGDLLARLMVREYQERVIAAEGEPTVPGGTVGESMLIYEALGDSIPLITPESALNYFLNLIPTLGVDPLRYGEDQRRSAFTLAVATGQELLVQVHSIISQAIETGETVSTAPKDIDRLMELLGVTPRNPQYAEMVFRTNYMDAVNTGAYEELRDPDVVDTFPVWQYLAIVDSRSRPWHAARNRLYYPASVPFVTIRGTSIEDAANCRCSFRPVSKWEWARLQSQGVYLQAA